jgi:hypothetical protein
VDFKLTGNGDLAVENGDFVFVTGIEAVKQDCAMTLRTWLGESVFNRNAGVPWIQIIFERGTPVHAVQFILENVLLGVDGVTDVIELFVQLDRVTRAATITGRIRALDQEFPLELAVTGVPVAA